MRVKTEKAAREVLLAEQERAGCIPTIPASHATIETPTGWAFFNVNGYLGTVTVGGECISEPEFEETD